MSVLFAGTEMESFATNNSSAREYTTAGRFDSAYVRCAIQAGDASVNHYIETQPLPAAETDVWLHMDFIWTTTNSNGGARWITLVNSSGTEVFKIGFTDTSGTIQAYYWNGSSWVAKTGTNTMTINTLYTVDLHLICGVSGSYELWVGPYNGTQAKLLEGTGLHASVDNVIKARGYNTTNFGGACSGYSQFVIADESTLGWKVDCSPATGNSAVNTGWTGSYTDIDEIPTVNTDFISAATDGLVETFTRAAKTLTGRSIKALVVAARAKNDGSSPANIEAALRVGGVNYFSAPLPGLIATYGPVQGIFEDDPSTAAPWDPATAGSAATEFGLRSAV
jgi:hypothetical protein